MAGIEYITEDLTTHPQCVHGPTLLFSRTINSKGDRRSFFACSACRDRKLCSFFLWEDERDKVSEFKRRTWERERQRLTPNIDHRKKFLQLNKMQQLNESKRNYCKTCHIIFRDEYLYEHVDHNVSVGITNQELTNPSTFLTPLSNDKKEAQYLFSNNTIKTITNILESLKSKNILCIGAPRIHEQIQTKHTHMTSLLLDLDHRYHNFYGPLQFCWYNMFNHTFFLPSASEVFSDFLQTDMGEGLAVIIDPPFGGRIEPLAQTLNKILKEYQSLNETTDKIPVYLFFPYFMEPQIVNSLSDYCMMDFKVDYDNHPLFQPGRKGRNHGSPVRIFTNMPLKDICLPEDEGYRYCKSCKRWVSQENKHCKMCKACTSKDGRTYVHCKICERCVKPTWQHCEKCNKCAQLDHTCGDLPFSQTCFHCKERGHKKNDCPKVNHESLKRKRMKKVELKKKGVGSNKNS